MTTTTTHQVTVKCGTPGCVARLLLTHDTLRAHNDAGTSPTCGMCAAKKSPAYKEAQARVTEEQAADKAKAHPDQLRPRTNSDCCLLAVWQLQQESKATQFFRTLVIVRAWEIAPERLGLDRRAAEFPDAKQIDVLLIQLTAKGLLARPQPNYYSLTEAGQKAVFKLAGAKS